MNYNIDYFINKFKAIPEDRWCVRALHDNGRACALGHCLEVGHIFSQECSEFIRVFGVGAPSVNNGYDQRYQQPTPKQRILAALYDIKKLQQPAYVDLTKSLAVLPEDKIEVDVKVKSCPLV